MLLLLLMSLMMPLMLLLVMTQLQSGGAVWGFNLRDYVALW